MFCLTSLYIRRADLESSWCVWCEMARWRMDHFSTVALRIQNVIQTSCTRLKSTIALSLAIWVNTWKSYRTVGFIMESVRQIGFAMIPFATSTCASNLLSWPLCFAPFVPIIIRRPKVAGSTFLNIAAFSSTIIVFNRNSKWSSLLLSPLWLFPVLPPSRLVPWLVPKQPLAWVPSNPAPTPSLNPKRSSPKPRG